MDYIDTVVSKGNRAAARAVLGKPWDVKRVATNAAKVVVVPAEGAAALEDYVAARRAPPTRVTSTAAPAVGFELLDDGSRARTVEMCREWLVTQPSTFTEEAFITAIGAMYGIHFWMYTKTTKNWTRAPDTPIKDATVVVMKNDDGITHFVGVDRDSTTAITLYGLKSLDEATTQVAFNQADVMEDSKNSADNFLCFFFSWLAFERGGYDTVTVKDARDRKSEACALFLQSNDAYEREVARMARSEAEIKLTRKSEEELAALADTTLSGNRFVRAKKRLALRQLFLWADTKGSPVLDVDTLMGIDARMLWDRLGTDYTTALAKLGERDLVRMRKAWFEATKRNLWKQFPYKTEIGGFLDATAVRDDRGTTFESTAVLVTNGMAVAKWLGSAESEGVYTSVGRLWRRASRAEELAYGDTNRTNYELVSRNGATVVVKKRGASGTITLRQGRPVASSEDIEVYMGDTANDGAVYMGQKTTIVVAFTGDLGSHMERLAGTGASVGVLPATTDKKSAKKLATEKKIGGMTFILAR